MKDTILNLDHKRARAFLLRAESYCSFKMPLYFDFQTILDKLGDCSQIPCKVGRGKHNKIKKLFTDSLSSLERKNVNYEFYINKDGRLDWRPLELINPIAYVYLVNLITEKRSWLQIKKRFKKFQSDKNIVCCSLPLAPTTMDMTASTINNWYSNFEKEAMKLSLQFEYMLSTDISNCYSSIYTHSIAWALHPKGRKGAKIDREPDKIYNVVDRVIQQISYSQTDGIPQGSVLMDFIAEIILGYVDLCLSIRIKSDATLLDDSYRIIRYRDDYKIFTKVRNDAEKIGRYLSEELSELNLRLNNEKTYITNNIITKTQKEDKLYWRNISKSDDPLIHILQIHSMSEKYPNTGSINKALSDEYDMLGKVTGVDVDYWLIASIATDIAYRNPNTYPMIIAILGKIFQEFSDKEKNIFIDDLISKFEDVPNSEYFNIWIQRLSREFPKKRLGDSRLCDYVRKSLKSKKNIDLNEIWNCEKFNGYKEINDIIKNTSIFDKKQYSKMSKYPKAEEVKIFSRYS